jgi:hypothetical protein
MKIFPSPMLHAMELKERVYVGRLPSCSQTQKCRMKIGQHGMNVRSSLFYLNIFRKRILKNMPMMAIQN